MADRLGRRTTSRLLGAQAAPDPRLDPPPPHDPLAVLGRMLRRGLDPDLVRRLRPYFAGRPLELGLFAWDVLTGSLMTDADEGLLDELRSAAALVAEVLPSPGERGVDTMR